MSSHGHEPNKKSQFMMLGATFIFGLVSGAILFLFNTIGNEGGGALEETNTGFVVIAHMYGGCAEGGGCPSYRITEDGSYEYIKRELGNVEKRSNGVLSNTQIKILRDRVTTTDFDALRQTTFADECPANLDGAAYRYEIEYLGEQYSLDSCVHNLGANMIFGSFQDYFELFRATHDGP